MANVDMKVLTVKLQPPMHCALSQDSSAAGEDGTGSCSGTGTRTELTTCLVPSGLLGVISGYSPLVWESRLSSCCHGRAATCPTGNGPSSVV
jgi:hypothetical protein